MLFTKSCLKTVRCLFSWRFDQSMCESFSGQLFFVRSTRNGLFYKFVTFVRLFKFLQNFSRVEYGRVKYIKGLPIGIFWHRQTCFRKLFWAQRILLQFSLFHGSITAFASPKKLNFDFFGTLGTFETFRVVFCLNLLARVCCKNTITTSSG